MILLVNLPQFARLCVLFPAITSTDTEDVWPCIHYWGFWNFIFLIYRTVMMWTIAPTSESYSKDKISQCTQGDKRVPGQQYMLSGCQGKQYSFIWNRRVRRMNLWLEGELTEQERNEILCSPQWRRIKITYVYVLVESSFVCSILASQLKICWLPTIWLQGTMEIQ